MCFSSSLLWFPAQAALGVVADKGKQGSQQFLKNRPDEECFLKGRNVPDNKRRRGTDDGDAFNEIVINIIVHLLLPTHTVVAAERPGPF